MKGYILDYINENEFKKLERALKKYNMLAFKKLNFDYYPSLRNGNFVGELVSVNKKNGTETYELKLPSDRMFAQIHGEVKLIYTVHKHDERIVLETITPSDILLEGHRSELTTYKGIMISKANASKDKFKIDLLTKLQDKMMLFIAVLTLIILVGGATYAYFTAQGGNGAQTNMNVTTHTTDSLVFEVGKPISIHADFTNFKEGMPNQADETVARATLKANSSTNEATRNYYIYLDITTNEFKYTTTEKTAELILTVIDPNDNPVTSINGLNYVTVGDVSGFDVTELNGLQELVSNYEIHSTGTKVDEWDIKLTLVNLDSDQNANAGKTFNATLKIQQNAGNSESETLTNHIIGLYTTQGANNLYHHDGTLENGINDGSYRYAGSYETTNNWVCFGTDAAECDDEHLYRIIGVFNEKTFGENGDSLLETEQRVKLIKAYPASDEQLGTNGKFIKNYNSNEELFADFGVSDIKSLNNVKFELEKYSSYGWENSLDDSEDPTTYYEEYINGNVYAYFNLWKNSKLNNINLNKNYLNSLNINWLNMISESIWYVGGTDELDDNPKVFYEYELGVNAKNDYPFEPYKAKIGLMYVSDYGFASSSDNWSDMFVYSGTPQNYINSYDKNWLFSGYNELTVTRHNFGGYQLGATIISGVYTINFSGYVVSSRVSKTHLVRPTFYLNSDVTYVRGQGTESNPYRIA